MRPPRMTMQPTVPVSSDDEAAGTPLRMTMAITDEPLPLRRARASEQPVVASLEEAQETKPA